MFEILASPPGMSEALFGGLILLSLLTSMLTASVGIGGGTIMLAVLAQVLPVKAIIPVHGVVQFGSNFGRTVMLLRDVRWVYFFWFSAGSIIGAILGGQIVVSLPVDVLRVVLGGFILYSVWGPKFTSKSKGPQTILTGGLLSTLLTMFVGATGPFILALLKALELPRFALVATNAACMVIQHLLKVIVFGVLGFAYGPYLLLIVLMITMGFVGTIIGKKILLTVDEEKFQIGVNVILTLLALRLLVTSLT